MALESFGINSTTGSSYHKIIFIVAFCLDFIGAILLAALLTAICLSDTLPVRRHPTLINLLFTSFLVSGFRTFSGICIVLWPRTERSIFDSISSLTPGGSVPESVTEGVKSAAGTVWQFWMITLQDVLWTTVQITMMNLVIHLWCIVRSVGKTEIRKAESLRLFFLVLTPYVFGLLPILALFALGNKKDIIPQAIIELAPAAIETLLILVTSIWDVLPQKITSKAATPRRPTAPIHTISSPLSNFPRAAFELPLPVANGIPEEETIVPDDIMTIEEVFEPDTRVEVVEFALALDVCLLHACVINALIRLGIFAFASSVDETPAMLVGEEAKMLLDVMLLGGITAVVVSVIMVESDA
ncbi:hypothetical protein M422DRAFT_773803 [Sphaerobolus stellatus SS14]|nr:hypothetical protein M422DRAFT_773803 [Sphaerobolus stellatus SS14]